MTTYKINPKDTPGQPRTWLVIMINDDGTSERAGPEYTTEDEARAAVRWFETSDNTVDYSSDWHTWKGHPLDEPDR